MKIVLGSQSVARKKILENMGYEFEVLASNVDEKAIRLKDPVELTLALANAKAEALISKVGLGVLLITSDQVVLCNGKILEKPENEEEVRYFMNLHALHPSETITSVVVTNTNTGKRYFGTDIAKIWFDNFPDDVIDEYILSGDPFLHAGGFDHEHPLIRPYVLIIDGGAESISGLPKNMTEKLLKQAKEGK